jgi:CubicO group peptidase (beta-lactamase class C family)
MSRTSSGEPRAGLHAVALGVRSLRQRKLFQALGALWSRSSCSSQGIAKMRVPPLTSAIALTLCLSTAAPADDLSTVGNPEVLGFSSARLTRITSWFQARVESGELPGAVLAIARNGKLAYLQAVGFQDHAKQVRMRPDSIFWIASMTKPVTSVAAMILVEQGKLDLDAPVAKYLPELNDMQVATEKTDLTTGTTGFTYEAQKRPMTVRDLLRHTSGLIYPPQYLDDPIHRLYREAVFKRDRTLADFITSLGKLPLAHQPGEVWEYSWGVDVLARIVEVQSVSLSINFSRITYFNRCTWSTPASTFLNRSLGDWWTRPAISGRPFGM